MEHAFRRPFHSRPKAAACPKKCCVVRQRFQLTAARRRLAFPAPTSFTGTRFQLAATRRRLGAARAVIYPHRAGFNSQPREGGWFLMMTGICSKLSFQLAATRRRLGGFVALFNFNAVVSTRSHAKAAGPLAAMCSPTILFQLAATRRRLDLVPMCCRYWKTFQLAATRRRLVCASATLA